MKKLITLIVAGSAMTVGTTAANAATASASASVEILEQVQITKVDDLDFGTIVADSSTSTTVSVAASAAGTRNCNGLTCSSSSSVGAAEFDIDGANGLTVDITIGSLTSLSGKSNSNTLSISLTGSDSSIKLNGSTATTYVGGTITVAANQAVDEYSGTFNVTAEYQ